jgi:hypothetical protein
MVRPSPSLSALLNSYAKRPSVVGGLAATVGVADLAAANALRKPLMGFFSEVSKTNQPQNGVPLVRPEHSRQRHPAQDHADRYAGGQEWQSLGRSQRPTTGLDYRPFSEPSRQPDMYEDWE